MKKGIVIFLTLCCLQSLMAQSHNRQVVIDMLLASFHHHNLKEFTTAAALHSDVLQINSIPSDLRFTDRIPKFCLPKGSIVCRLEEYVQLHTPIKLNIGLAGQ